MKGTHNKKRMLVLDTEGLDTRLGQHRSCKSLLFILFPFCSLHLSWEGGEVKKNKKAHCDPLLTIVSDPREGEALRGYLTSECIRKPRGEPESSSRSREGWFKRVGLKKEG